MRHEAIDFAAAAQVPVLKGLDPQALAVLLAEATTLSVRPGHVLFRQGELALNFFLVLEGWVKLARLTKAGDEAVLNVATRGECFAEAAILAAEQYSVTATAVTPVRLMAIPIDHVMNCVRTVPDVAVAIIASIAQHLQQMAQQVEQLTAQSATQRVAEFLLSFACCAKGPCTIVLPYDKSLIAGRLGLKPESLSRVFAKLRLIGVDVCASSVLVQDVAELRKLVRGDRIRPRGTASPHLGSICYKPPLVERPRSRAAARI